MAARSGDIRVIFTCLCDALALPKLAVDRALLRPHYPHFWPSPPVPLFIVWPPLFHIMFTLPFHTLIPYIQVKLESMSCGFQKCGFRKPYSIRLTFDQIEHELITLWDQSPQVLTNYVYCFKDNTYKYWPLYLNVWNDNI